MSADLPPKLQEYLDHLQLFEERTERIEALISIAEKFVPVPAEIATRPYDEAHRVPGCESEAFVWAIPKGNTLDYYFAVENPQGISAMALCAMLQASCSGAPLEQVANVPDEIVFEIFGRELSMGKTMGLTGIVQRVRSAAKEKLK